MKLVIIIPALNEEKSVPHVIDDLKKNLNSIDYVSDATVIVADNGSSDKTSDVARSCGVQVVPAYRRGYGSACLAGLSAMPKDTDVVVFMDGDYSDVADDLPAILWPLYENTADLVLGERITLAHDVLTPQQRFGNAFACALMRLVHGHVFRDLGPFRAIRRSSLEMLHMQDPAFGWTIEMQIKAVKQGLRIKEIPVHYRTRIGKSKISGTLLGSFRAGRAILWSIVKFA